MKSIVAAAVIAAVALPAVADAGTLRLRLAVPSKCVARAVDQTSRAISLATFCNSARGGTVYAVGSVEGTPMVLEVGGRQVRVGPGQRAAVFSSDGPFRDRLALSIRSGQDASSVALLFQAVPN